MVEPVTTVLTGLALARQGIDFLKTNMDSLNDASELSAQIANIFKGQDEFNKARYDPAEAKKMGIKDIASEMIEFKLQQEQMYDLKRLVNHRFGLGFWESIVAERAKRIEEHKELIKEQERKKRRERQEFIDTMQTVGIVIAIVLALVGLIMLFFILTKEDSFAKSNTRPSQHIGITVDEQSRRESASKTKASRS